jgi:hypothetical protein
MWAVFYNTAATQQQRHGHYPSRMARLRIPLRVNRASSYFGIASLGLAIIFLWTGTRNITQVGQSHHDGRRGGDCDIAGGRDATRQPWPSRLTRLHNNKKSRTNIYYSYQPAWVEEWIMSHLVQLGWNVTDPLPSGCDVWNDPTTTTTTTITTTTTKTTMNIHNELHSYLNGLDAYHAAVEQFPGVSQDLRTTMIETMRRTTTSRTNGNNNNNNNNNSEMELKGLTASEKRYICQSVQLHPDGLLHGFFSGQANTGGGRSSDTDSDGPLLLSFSNQSAFGYIEPLLTPMRNPHFCTDFDHHNNKGQEQQDKEKHKLMFSLNYMVHDFEHLCFHQLQPHSRTVFIDMGASLKFHGDSDSRAQPMVDLIRLYQKFGITFDHIYGFEIKKISAKEAYQLIPQEYMASYHWINVGVSHQRGHKKNPLDSIVRKFHPDDLVIVKLDIDTNYMELALAQQLLEDDSLSRLVDHFYFEQHVHMKEIAFAWTESMAGTLADTLALFQGLRRKGVAAHFWP